MHNSFIQPGIDRDVILKQAYARANDKRYPEATMVHYHRYTERCNDKCRMIEKGKEKKDG